LVSCVVANIGLAQPRWPEAGLPRLPADGGVLSQRVSASFPILAVVSTPTDAGLVHQPVWDQRRPHEGSLYQSLTLTFVSLSGGGTIRLADSNGKVASKNAHVFAWPRPLQNWQLTDLGPGDVPGSRLFVLREFIGSGCPGTSVEHWLQVRGGKVTQLLETKATGEGVDDTLDWHGTSARWPSFEADAGTSDLELPGGELRFPEVDDVPAGQRVVMVDADIRQGRTCRASRTLFRYADGGLTEVRVEHLDAGPCEP
jgi:hypothetical protein